jgi:hypothetical protein
MVVRVIQIARLLIILASRHRSLVFENLALRQQLAVYAMSHRIAPRSCWSRCAPRCIARTTLTYNSDRLPARDAATAV